MGKPIVICGFMGSGKTTVGRLLAKRLLDKFIDLDEEIEHECYVVYLSTDFDICYERIKSSNRPLVMQNTREQLRALYDQRHEVYAGLCNTQLYNHGAPERTVTNIISLINPLSIQKL